jgi:hypothetical protein
MFLRGNILVQLFVSPRRAAASAALAAALNGGLSEMIQSKIIPL